DATRAAASTGTRFVWFDTTVGGSHYQTIEHLLYTGDERVRLFAAVGFTVNLDWVRTHYFIDFVRDIRAIINDPALDIAVVDEGGAPVGTPVGAADGNTMSRPFPLLFADPVVTRARSGAQLPDWRILVRVRDDGPLLAARGANRTLTLLAVTGLIAVVALALTLRSARAADKLAALQAEFVSAMSHEMKTPLSLITLATGTLASGRYYASVTVRG